MINHEQNTGENGYEEPTFILPPEEAGEEGNTLDDTTTITETLSETDWIREAEQIPLDTVTENERRILIKCINHYTMDSVEMEELQTILAKYRPAIQKIKPGETLKNVEDNIALVHDEKEFLRIVDSFDEIQVIPFTYYTSKGIVRMKFDLYPLTDSEAITDITSNLSMFKDFTDEELITYNKIQNGENLTREEILVRARMEEKIRQATQDNQRQTIIEYLSIQLKFHGKDSSITDMREVFKHIPFTYLALLFSEVQNRNHLSDLRVENVFQEFSE